MARSITTQVMAEEFDRKGMFKGLADFVKEGSMSAQEANQIRTAVFKLFLKQVHEAKSEVNHLKGSIERLEHICRAGASARPGAIWVDRPSELERLAQEIMTFDGWVVSLYETAITMMYFGNPDRARAKPTEMVNSLEALRQKRVRQLDLDLKDPSLFKFA
jgi:hypothetical protein